jgi:uncharacterized membrane protein YoaK (UPF0700 family)
MSSLPIKPNTIDFPTAEELESTKRTSTAPDEAITRAPGWQAAVLAIIAGYIDSYVFLNYKVYGSFMSGNTTQTGLQTGQGKLAEAGLDLLPIPLFVAGVFVGTLLMHSRPRRRLSWLFGSVAALLAVAMAAADPGVLPGWSGIILLSLAMGIMNTTVTRVGEQSVSLGYVTGDLNNLAQHLALAVKRVPVPHGSGDSHARRATLLAGLWAAFLIGAALAGAATPRFAAWTLLPPILALLALIAFGRAMMNRHTGQFPSTDPRGG